MISKTAKLPKMKSLYHAVPKNEGVGTNGDEALGTTTVPIVTYYHRLTEKAIKFHQ